MSVSKAALRSAQSWEAPVPMGHKMASFPCMSRGGPLIVVTSKRSSTESAAKPSPEPNDAPEWVTPDPDAEILWLTDSPDHPIDSRHH